MSTRTEAPKSNDLPVGTTVLAFPGSRDGRAIMTTTRSEPWDLPSGDRVVMVEGYAGGIALNHIEVVPPAASPAPEQGDRAAITLTLEECEQLEDVWIDAERSSDLRAAVARIVADRLAAALARAAAAEAKVDKVLGRLGIDLAQQHMAAEHHKRAGLDDRHHYGEYHRFTQGRWAFWESARLICQETRRNFEAFLAEHDPRHEEYDR